LADAALRGFDSDGRTEERVLERGWDRTEAVAPGSPEGIDLGPCARLGQSTIGFDAELRLSNIRRPGRTAGMPPDSKNAPSSVTKKSKRKAVVDPKDLRPFTESTARRSILQ
jgi:hypothetical protein